MVLMTTELVAFQTRLQQKLDRDMRQAMSHQAKEMDGT
jgi:hypothetical protein